MSEIDSLRALLSAKPRPVGWAERRARIDEVGSVWPVAHDIQLMPVDLGGVRGELSAAPGSDASRMLLFFHGGGYCSGSIVSHRRMVTEAGRAARVTTLAVEYRLAPEDPFPAAHEDALTAWRYLRAQGIAPGHIAVGQPYTLAGGDPAASYESHCPSRSTAFTRASTRSTAEARSRRFCSASSVSARCCTRSFRVVAVCSTPRTAQTFLWRHSSVRCCVR